MTTVGFVNRFLKIPGMQRLLYRKISFRLEHLTQRSIINLSGNDVYAFLQGLITNDINLLHEKRRALFTLLLNTKGRILYDVLLYRKSENEVLLECDSSCKNDMLKHLRLYCIRKKINFELLNDNVWVVYNFDEEDEKFFQSSDVSCITKWSRWKAKTAEYEQGYKNVFEKLTKENCLWFKDPRSLLMGFRIVASAKHDVSEILSSDEEVRNNELDDFKIHRYKLGIAEGVRELPPGNCFPLEANADYLGGVSFNKGCYLGQELTARTYHTGVIRKRVMPIVLSAIPKFEITDDLPIVTRDGKNCGKLRGVCDKYGVALLRVAEALQNHSDLMIGDVVLSTYKPCWWPVV